VKQTATLQWISVSTRPHSSRHTCAHPNKHKQTKTPERPQPQHPITYKLRKTHTQSNIETTDFKPTTTGDNSYHLISYNPKIAQNKTTTSKILNLEW